MHKELKSELSGNFKEGMCDLVLEPAEYDAHIINKAIKVIEFFIQNIGMKLNFFIVYDLNWFLLCVMCYDKM